MSAPRFPSIAALIDPGALAALLGPVARVERAPLGAAGRSGATHERLVVALRGGETVRLVLKRIRPSVDWTARRTGDRVGREALLLAEPRLAQLWESFACPYRAFAIGDDEAGLLLDDLTPWLAQTDAPLDEQREDALLAALARTHARFWEHDALDLPWLAPATTAFTILGPRLALEETERRPPDPLGALVVRGWELALARVSPRVRDLLLLPLDQLSLLWEGLPRTLVHGDVKAANAAWLPDGRVAAFDWMGVSATPVGRELGYYLAITRLARSKEATLARYRALLETARGAALSDDLWRRQVNAAVLAGAFTLLWQKALGAEQQPLEWGWWAERLEALAVTF